MVVTTADGEPVGEVPLPPSGEFALTYRHSVYAVPVTESFHTSDEGTFAMVAVSSPSEAVLDYYAVEGTRSRAGGWWHERLAQPAWVDQLRIVGTRVGQRTLSACGRRIPLYPSARPAIHVALHVERRR